MSPDAENVGPALPPGKPAAKFWRGTPLASPLPEIGDELAAWAERAARRAEREAKRWEAGDLARGADDRKWPHQPADDGDAWRSDQSANGEPQTTSCGNPVASWQCAGIVPPPPLGSTSEVISTGSRNPLQGPDVDHAGRTSWARYRLAVERVDAALELCELRVLAAWRAAREDWSMSSWRHAAALERKAMAVRRRRLALRACVVGRIAAGRFVCRCCGGTQHGAAAGCNARYCPRCLPKLRAQNIAKVRRILELVDQRRDREHRRMPHWRFVTLTVPSWIEFEPMRRFVGAAHARLHRRPVWADVGACLTALETTHTAAGWHVHVHALVDAFLPWVTLVRTWRQVCLSELLHRVEHRQPLALAGGAGAAARAVADDAELRRVVVYRGKALVALWQRAPHDAPEPMPGGDDDAARALRALLDALPTGAGQHVSDVGADRERAIREVAKYAAKDLGGAQVEDADEWGVAGTPERLADFLLGSFRWRTLRTYGDAWDAARDLAADDGAMECDGCGAQDMEFLGVDWFDADAWSRIEAERRRRRRQRGPPGAALAGAVGSAPVC